VVVCLFQGVVFRVSSWTGDTPRWLDGLSFLWLVSKRDKKKYKITD